MLHRRAVWLSHRALLSSSSSASSSSGIGFLFGVGSLVAGGLIVAEVAVREETNVVPRWIADSEAVRLYRVVTNRKRVAIQEEEETIQEKIPQRQDDAQDGVKKPSANSVLVSHAPSGDNKEQELANLESQEAVRLKLEASRLIECRHEALKSARVKTDIALECLRVKQRRLEQQALEDLNKEHARLLETQLTAVRQRVASDVERVKRQIDSRVEGEYDVSEALNKAAIALKSACCAQQTGELLRHKFLFERIAALRVDTEAAEMAAEAVPHIDEQAQQAHSSVAKAMVVSKPNTREAALRARYFESVRPAIASSEMAPASTKSMTSALAGLTLSKLATPKTIVVVDDLVRAKQFEEAHNVMMATLNQDSLRLARDWLDEVKQHQLSVRTHQAADASVALISAARSV